MSRASRICLFSSPIVWLLCLIIASSDASPRRHHHSHHDESYEHSRHEDHFGSPYGHGRKHGRSMETMIGETAAGAIANMASKAWDKGSKMASYYLGDAANSALEYGKDALYNLGSTALSKAGELGSAALDKGASALHTVTDLAQTYGPTALSIGGATVKSLASKGFSAAYDKGTALAGAIANKALDTAKYYGQSLVDKATDTATNMAMGAMLGGGDDETPAGRSMGGRRSRHHQHGRRFIRD